MSNTDMSYMLFARKPVTYVSIYMANNVLHAFARAREKLPKSSC